MSDTLATLYVYRCADGHMIFSRAYKKGPLRCSRCTSTTSTMRKVATVERLDGETAIQHQMRALTMKR